MKKDFVMHLIRMTMVIVMFFCGAGSAFAQSETQSENDYFSLAGTESESIKYYTTLGDAVNAAADGDKITLLKDYTITVSTDDNVTTDTRGVSINKSITLDLNDHKITRDNSKEIEEYRGALISIDGATLTLVDDGADKSTMGSIENIDFPGVHAIIVGKGTLIAKGVLTSSNGETVHIDEGGTAVIDDCVIEGDGAINLYGTATITNSDISARYKGVIRVGEYVREGDDNYVIHTGHLTIGDGVYMSSYWTPPYIDYVAGTVILKALPTFGQNRPTTSSTTRAKARAKTRTPDYHDIAMKSGLSLTFEEGTFQTPEQPMSIKIFDNDGPVDPATYTNPITTNYSKYVKDGGEVIDPNKVFKWEDFDKGFRLNTAGEVILNHAAATVTSYSGTTTSHYDFSEAIAAANSGYKTASEAGSTEFIPTLKMLDDVSIDTGVEIGDGETTTKVTLDLNDKEISGAVSGSVFTVKSGATLTLVDNGTDNSKGMVWNSKNETGTNCIYVWDDGEFTATGVSIKSDMGTALLNNGSTTVGEGVSFSGNREASIYNNQGTLTLTAWPTFGDSETEGYADIKLSNGRTVTFGGTGLRTPTQKVTLRVVDYEIHDISAEFLPVAITSNYAEKVKDTNGVIDPNEVFSWYNEYAYFGVALNADGETAIYAPTTFTFADGQKWMTWCDKNEWRLPDGIEAYCITGVTASAITIEKLTGTTIPAYEPLLLKKVGTVDFTAILTAKPVAPSSGYDAATGIVTATVSGATFYGNTNDAGLGATAIDGYVYSYDVGTATQSYILRSGDFIVVDNAAGDIAAHRCWLNVTTDTSNARILTIAISDESTGIKSMVNGQCSMVNDQWYDLQGRKIDRQPTKKGLYIRNSRKVIVK